MAGPTTGGWVGIASWLGCFATIVIACSMAAVAFGSYPTLLFLLLGIAGYRAVRRPGRARRSCWARSPRTRSSCHFAGDTLQNQPQTLVAIVAIALLSVALDSVWKHSGTRHARASPASGDVG